MPSTAAVLTVAADSGVVHAGPCTLHRVIVGALEVGTTVSIYDDANGDPVGLVAEIATDEVATFDLAAVALRSGLTVVTTMSAGTGSVTVVWS